MNEFLFLSPFEFDHSRKRRAKRRPRVGRGGVVFVCRLSYHNKSQCVSVRAHTQKKQGGKGGAGNSIPLSPIVHRVTVGVLRVMVSHLSVAF